MKLEHFIAPYPKINSKKKKKREVGSIPGLQRSPGGGNGNPLQYSCLESPVDRGARWSNVQRLAELAMTEVT